MRERTSDVMRVSCAACGFSMHVCMHACVHAWELCRHAAQAARDASHSTASESNSRRTACAFWTTQIRLTLFPAQSLGVRDCSDCTSTRPARVAASCLLAVGASAAQLATPRHGKPPPSCEAHPRQCFLIELRLFMRQPRSLRLS